MNETVFFIFQNVVLFRSTVNREYGEGISFSDRLFGAVDFGRKFRQGMLSNKNFVSPLAKMILQRLFALINGF